MLIELRRANRIRILVLTSCASLCLAATYGAAPTESTRNGKMSMSVVSTDLAMPVVSAFACGLPELSMFCGAIGTNPPGVQSQTPGSKPSEPVPQCRIVRAQLIDRNGPNGGWCWRVWTDCGEVYLKGDCRVTE